MPEAKRELTIYRRLLLISSSLYFFWWFGIHWIVPEDFNPLFSRVLICSSAIVVWSLSFYYRHFRIHIKAYLTIFMWLLTAHYFYLFYSNEGNVNWVVGTYITITAISFTFFSQISLLYYSIFVTLLSLGLIFVMPSLHVSLFLPGLLTILFQANIALRSRLEVIKNLENSKKRFQLLFHNTFEGVLVHDQQKILNVNESMARMFEYTVEEMIGMDVLNLRRIEDREEATARLLYTDLIPHEVIAVTKNGKYINFEVRGKVFDYDGKEARLVTLQNIEDRKKAEEERIKAMTLAENLRIRDEFISIASHELNTPLSSLKIQGQLIERDIRNNNLNTYDMQRIKDVTSMFNRQIDRLADLVATMLDVSRISAGRLLIDKQEIDLAKNIRECVKFTKATHTSVPIEVLGLDRLIVQADSLRIDQVIENLLTNAIKYGNGKPIQVRLQEQGSDAIMLVKDSGMGISPESLERVFNRFERAISAKRISGLGLGLYITRKIVEAHGGSITVDSKLDHGSTFIVRLPKS